MAASALKLITEDQLGAMLSRTEDAVDARTLAQAREIVDDVKADAPGHAAFARHAVRLGDLPAADSPFTVPLARLKEALDALPAAQRDALRRMAGRVTAFATAQRAAITDIDIPIPGGRAGHRVQPVRVAGCYAPGGRYPLPSSVLMTAITARVAGVEQVWVASPNPAPATLAAAHLAGVDGFICVGGAQAIAAMAYGVGPIPAADVIVGPGNRWVTAAKKLVSGRVGIDMLAGPSECLVLADGTANAATVAADLLAQAEHDTDARAVLVTTDAAMVDAVNSELSKQLATLPTAATARVAVERAGFAMVAPDLDTAIRLVDRIAPEHLEVMTADAAAVGKRLRNYGGLFVGAQSAEVMGDYGAGPNHVLPTGGTGRYTGGLSVFTFLAIRTWMELDKESGAAGLKEVVADAVTVARVEGLEGHARAAEVRVASLSGGGSSTNAASAGAGAAAAPDGAEPPAKKQRQ